MPSLLCLIVPNLAGHIKWRHESLTMEPLPVALKKRFGLLVATGLLGLSLPRTTARSS
jgi:hypothetical protein